MGAGFGNLLATGFGGGGAFFFEELAHPEVEARRIAAQDAVKKRNAIFRKAPVVSGRGAPGLGISVDVMINISIAAEKT
jgi:hypothetical protein